jgi:hypothetical protein
MPVLNPRFAPESFAPALAQHVFLIAIHSEPEVPFLHRGHPMQRMQVLLMNPEEGLSFIDRDDTVGPLPALPPRRLMAPDTRPARIPCEITGEILRDRNGKLYEKVGNSVRPVNQLFTGARGEMIDLVPVRNDGPDSRFQQRPSGAAKRAEDATEPSDPGEDAAASTSDSNQDAKPLREVVRPLIPEPGLWRLVRYADFLDAITPQLADPRRLRPGHQLACYVQVLELTVTQTLGALEQSAAHELGSASKLLPLSYDLCRRFGLSLPRPSFALAGARRAYAPGVAPAGSRFLTLRVAFDPTADATPRADPQVAPPSGTTPKPDSPASPAPAESVSRSSIPEEFMKPWELKFTRDEAVYDMTLATSKNKLQRFLARVKNRISASELKKWHALLLGKTPEQQLWGVTPPKGATTDPRIRRWAEQTLQLGGYDVARMLVEWEIYWRRKGL